MAASGGESGESSRKSVVNGQKLSTSARPYDIADKRAVHQGQATIDNPLIDARKTWMICGVVAQLWEQNASVINRS